MSGSDPMAANYALYSLDKNGQSTVKHSGCEILVAKGWIKDDNNSNDVMYCLNREELIYERI